ncbi:hypothetical protein LTR78_005727 [Recurvomyces mirabilis]|uniref:Major facilitator superfamily (MFS) profile domain-containing protein n=1 Tax=Recurvomyces mirabilis TaxID=574656 RepID=A0AAE1C0U6_9PEZI|nr:hypothetical protein LTR78_005727 [Recurvomyces mirabilis]KAK5154107.1 hypothetical protein LTS14_006792 [Recurvomyces mirabilis]
MAADKEAMGRKTSTSSDLASPITEPVTTEELPAKDVEASPKDEPEYEWLTGMKLWAVMGPLILVFFLVLLDTTIISTAIPKITNHFNSLKDIGWYTASYQLASAVLQPLAGKLYVNFSNKWTFISFFALFEFGSLLCGVANSSKMLIVGRAVAGMGTAGLQNGAFTIISASVPLHKRPALIGILQALAQLGIVFGPLIGGALTQYTTWRWCFYINLPIGAVAAVLLVFDKIPDAYQKPPAMEVLRDIHHKLDLIGFVLFAPAVIMLLLAMLWGGNDYAWNSATVIGLFCGFGGLIIVWAAWNWYKKDDALIPISMITKTTVWSGCVVVGCLMAGLYIAAYYLPIYFQSVYGASPTMSGVYLLPNIIAALLAAVIAGKLVGMIGYYTPFAILAAILMSIGLGLCGMLGVNSSTGDWIGFQILFGVGRGMGMQMPIVAVQNRLPPTMAPLAIALCMFTGMLFGALFLSASATIFTNSLSTLIPKYSPGADVQAIVTAGATGFRDVVPLSQLPGILIAYAKSVNRVFYLCAALAALCLPFSFGLGWTNIKEKKKAAPQAKVEVNKGEETSSDSAV